MTDSAIADTLNRHVAQLVAQQLDCNDDLIRDHLTGPWFHSPIADTIMSDNDATNGDRAWLIGSFAARTPGVDFDGHPADCDWDNLFSHFRAEILARRDPQSHPARAAEIPARDGVGSR
jgi:hypothetical protein